MNTKEDLINTEVMGGWPIFKMNLKEILKSLGAIEKDGFIGFDLSNEILNIYPKRLMDDGMGYGIYPEWFIEVDCGKDWIHIFTDKELPKKELDKIKSELFSDGRK